MKIMTDLLNFILLICAGVGLSHILADGSIMAPFKFWLADKNNWFCNKFLEMLTCYQCNGVYSGAVVYIIYRISPLFDSWPDLVLWGLALSFISHFVGLKKMYWTNLISVDTWEDKNEEK
jgi:hypothetical protein